MARPDAGGVPGDWGTSPIQPPITVSGTEQVSGYFVDTPQAGTWWYGIHVVDVDGVYSTEQHAGLGPTSVTVNALLSISSVTPSALQVLEQGQSVTYSIMVDDGGGEPGERHNGNRQRRVAGGRSYVADHQRQWGSDIHDYRSRRAGQRNLQHRLHGQRERIHRRSLCHTTGASAIPQTIVYWSGGSLGTGTNWDTATNWVGGVLPGPNSDVVINAPAGITVNHSGGTDGIHSLRSFSPLTLASGTLAVATTVEVDNSFTMSGGTLLGATVLRGSGGQGVTFGSSTSTLDGVTVNGDLDLQTNWGDCNRAGWSGFERDDVLGQGRGRHVWIGILREPKFGGRQSQWDGDGGVRRIGEQQPHQRVQSFGGGRDADDRFGDHDPGPERRDHQ